MSNFTADTQLMKNKLSPDAVDLKGLPDEVLNLISLGAHALMGGTPSEDWGQHTGAPVDEDTVYSNECRTCHATQWFDAAQDEMRRRETSVA